MHGLRVAVNVASFSEYRTDVLTPRRRHVIRKARVRTKERDVRVERASQSIETRDGSADDPCSFAMQPGA